MDVALSGDTLTAWMPGERMGVRVPSFSDSVGLRDPAQFLGRALTAVWPVPPDAWRGAVADSAGATLEWTERDERWTLRVDAAGRPREVSVTRAQHTVTARYGAWHGAGPAAWPARVALSDGGGSVQVRIEVEGLRSAKRSRPAWFALVLPDGARRLELDDVKRVLSSRGGTR